MTQTAADLRSQVESLRAHMAELEENWACALTFNPGLPDTVRGQMVYYRMARAKLKAAEVAERKGT